jgi:hypothetical protein
VTAIKAASTLYRQCRPHRRVFVKTVDYVDCVAMATITVMATAANKIRTMVWVEGFI